MKREKRRTIGKMTQTRGVWTINPRTRVKRNKRKHPDRRETKALLKKGKWDDLL